MAVEEDETQGKQAEDKCVFLRFGDDGGVHPNAKTVRDLSGHPYGTTIKASAGTDFPGPNIRIASGKDANGNIGKSAGTGPTDSVVQVVTQRRRNPRSKIVRGNIPEV